MLHDSIRYQNICSRDPITLLSIDIVVETFLEIGVSDLLVSTQCLQDPLYMELCKTYLSLSIGLGKWNFMISHNILLIMSVVEWLTSRITHLCLPFSNFKLIKQVYCNCYNLNLSPTSHELGDAVLLRRWSTLFLQEYNMLPLRKFNYLQCCLSNSCKPSQQILDWSPRLAPQRVVVAQGLQRSLHTFES